MTSLLDGLVAYWPLDETSGTRYDVRGTNHLSPWNAPGYADGKIDRAVVCDAAKALYHASNDQLSLGDVPHTLSLWIYMTSKPAYYQGIVAKYLVGGTHEFLLYYDYVTDRLLWRPASGCEVFSNALGSPSLNTWYHLACWYDPDAEEAGMRINDSYEDTEPVGTAAITGSSDFEVGSFDMRNNPNIGFRGRIDELYLWKRLLASDEKTLMYNLYDYPWGATLNRGSFRGMRQGIVRGV